MDVDRPGEPGPNAPAIETEGLTKLYPGGHGIAELTLTVEPGEVFGFLGPNGAGKTTTIRTLLDLVHPTAGTARLLGLDSPGEGLRVPRHGGHRPGAFACGRATTGRRALELMAHPRAASTARAEELARRFQADLEQ